METFFQSLVEKPLIASFEGRPGYITSGAARSILFLSLMVPRAQPIIAYAFAAAMSDAKNGTGLLGFLHNPIGTPPGHGGDVSLARLGVTCADSPSEPAPTAGDLADEILTGIARHGRFATSAIFTEVNSPSRFASTSSNEEVLARWWLPVLACA